MCASEARQRLWRAIRPEAGGEPSPLGHWVAFMRSGRLPVFAVSEPSVRLKQDALALPQGRRAIRGPGSNTLQQALRRSQEIGVFLRTSGVAVNDGCCPYACIAGLVRLAGNRAH